MARGAFLVDSREEHVAVTVGPYLDMVRDALYAPVAKERGLFQPDAVDALLADPNGRLTPLRGNELWQIALLELWLQKHGISGPAA